MLKLLFVVTLTSLQQCFGGLVADTLWFEARGESKRGQLAVATVIYNRAQNTGRTFEAVCKRPEQFSCWNQGYHPPKPRTKAEHRVLEFLKAIERSMHNGTFKPLGKFTSYFNPELCSPSWGKDFSCKIGNHLFGIAK